MKIRILHLIYFLNIAFVNFIIAGQSFCQNNNYLYSTNQIIIGFKHSISEEEILTFVKEYNCKLIGPVDKFRVYTLILPGGLEYDDVKGKFQKDFRVRYVLPNYSMFAQSRPALVEKLRLKNRDILTDIGFLQAEQYLAKYDLLSDKNNLLFVSLDSSGLHPELIQQLNSAGLYYGGVRFEATKDGSIRLVDSVDEYINGHGTQIVTLLSSLGKSSKIMHIQIDGLGTFIEGIKYAIRQTQETGERLIINSSMCVSLESVTYDAMRYTLRDYYLACRIEEAKTGGYSDIDIYNNYKQFRSDAISKAYSTVDEIFKMVSSGEISNFQNWNENDWAIIKERFSLSEEEINVLKYSEFVARREFGYFVKSGLCEDFEKFSQHAIIVSSAGNFYNSGMSFPSAYNGVIGVGSYHNNHIADYSRYGEAVDIYTPGGYFYGDIWTYDIQNGNLVETLGKRGTSFSAAFVSVLTGLIWNAFPNLTPAEIKDMVMLSAGVIFDDKLKTYFGKINGQKLASLAYIYSSVKEMIDDIMGCSRGDCDLLEEINNNPLFYQGLIPEILRDALLEDIEIFLSGRLDAKELTRNLLTKLWVASSNSDFHLASGLVINYLGDKDILKFALEKNISGISFDAIQRALDMMENENLINIFTLERTLKTYQNLENIFKDFMSGNVSFDSFMESIDMIFESREELKKEYEVEFVNIFNKFIAGESDFKKTQQEIFNTLWNIKDESIKMAVGIKIDTSFDIDSLKSLLVSQFPSLESSILDIIIHESILQSKDTHSITLFAFHTANACSVLDKIFSAIDDFKSTWDRRLVSPLEYLTLKELKTWDDWSKFLEQSIQKKNYIQEASVYKNIESFYTGVVENLTAIFSGQKVLSEVFKDTIDGIIWNFVIGEKDAIETKQKLLKAIEQESKLPYIQLSVDIIRSTEFKAVSDFSIDIPELVYSLPLEYEVPTYNPQFENFKFDFPQFL